MKSALWPRGRSGIVVARLGDGVCDSDGVVPATEWVQFEDFGGKAIPSECSGWSIIPLQWSCSEFGGSSWWHAS